MSSKRQFFVYVYRDPLTHEPFYVGKGQGYRDRKHLHQTHNVLFANKLSALKNAGITPNIEKVNCADESEAFAVEAHLIAAYGRKINESGSLFNVLEGGEKSGGFIGRKHSQKTKDKIRAALTGRTFSKETLSRMRITGLKRDNSHLHSETAKARQREVTSSAEYRAKMSRRVKESVSNEHLQKMTEAAAKVNRGRKVSDDTRAKISAANRSRQISEESRMRMSAAQKRRYAK